MPPPPAVIERAKARLAEAGEGASVAQTRAVFREALPQCDPDPIAYVAKHDDGALRGIHFLQELQRLLGDCERLRQHALGPNGRIRNPRLFGQTIKLKATLLKTALNVLQEAYAMGRMERAKQLILDAIREASPETARQIGHKLKAMDAKKGIYLGD